MGNLQISCLIFFHMYTGITAEKLEWGDSDQLKQILGSHLGGFDLILGADIYILIIFNFILFCPSNSKCSCLCPIS